MPLTLSVALTRPTAVEPSPNVLRVAAMFGLGVDASRELVVVPRIDVPIAGGSIVFITGPSGGGKSSILRLIADELALRDTPAVRFEDMPEAPDRALVDCFGDPREHEVKHGDRHDATKVPAEPADSRLRDALSSLALAGLSDAFVMLRRPSELSDGQRYRFRLARVFHEVMRERVADEELAKPQAGAGMCEGEIAGGVRGGDVAVAARHGDALERERLRVVLADEFGATLDRVTAQTLARNVRRWTSTAAARHVCFIAATTHDDLLEPFEPDVLIFKDLGERATVMVRGVTITGSV